MSRWFNGSVISEDAGPYAANATQGILRAYHYKFAPAVGAAGAIHGAITLPSSGTTTVTSSITQPDFPRFLAITGGALLMAGNVVIHGKDISGATVSDTIALSGVVQVLGVVAFGSVTSIVVPTRTTAGDTVTIDTLNVFGVPHIVSSARYVLLHDFYGSNDAGTFTVDASLDKNVYAVAGTPNGSKFIDLIYLVQ